LFLMPYAYVIVGSAFKNIDPALVEASRVSGGSVGRTALRVSLPLVLPAIMGAGLLLAIAALSLYSAPVIVAPTAGIADFSSPIATGTASLEDSREHNGG